MTLSSETLTGLLALGLPELLVVWIILRRNRAIFLFAVALMLVGLGYLAATGTAADIGKVLLALLNPRAAALGRS